MGDLMAQGYSIGQALHCLSRGAVLPGPASLNILEPKCIRDQHANVFSVWVIESAQLRSTEALSAGHTPRGGAGGRSTFKDSRTSSSMYASQAEVHVITIARFKAAIRRVRPEIPTGS